MKNGPSIAEQKDGKIKFESTDDKGRKIICEGEMKTKIGKDGVIENHIDIRKVTKVNPTIHIGRR